MYSKIYLLSQGAWYTRDRIHFSLRSPRSAERRHSLPIQRYSIAHEIGHILLGHNHTENITRSDEDETERFAIDLLAPACVLWGLDLHTPEEISAACNISITSAKIRAERMKILYARGKFLLHPLERQVYKQFEEFIKNYKK